MRNSPPFTSIVLAAALALTSTALAQPVKTPEGLRQAQMPPLDLPTDTGVQVSPPDAGSTRPSTDDGRPRLVVPEGYEKLRFGGRVLLVTPADRAWVTAAIERAMTAPVTRPSTMPAEIIGRVRDSRADLIRMLSTDLAISEVRVEGWVDDGVLKALTEFEASAMINVPMVVTRDRAKALLAGGWENPAFRFNRLTGEVGFSQTLVISTDEDSPDALVPFLYDPTAPEEDRIAQLATALGNLDASVLRARAQRGQFILQAALLRFIGNGVLEDLNLRDDQGWLAAGLSGILTAKYTSMLSGVPRRQIVQAMTIEPARGRGIPARSIDLLAPLDPNAMRREMILPYVDAVRRKSVRAMDELVLRKGDEVIPLLLTKVRELKPADGTALRLLVEETTGVDLTPWLRSGG